MSGRDRERERIRVFRRHGDRFADPVTLSPAAGEMLTAPLVDRLTLPLARMFVSPRRVG